MVSHAVSLLHAQEQSNIRTHIPMHALTCIFILTRLSYFCLDSVSVLAITNGYYLPNLIYEEKNLKNYRKATVTVKMLTLHLPMHPCAISLLIEDKLK